MKKILIFLCTMQFIACTEQRMLNVEFTNQSRSYQMHISTPRAEIYLKPGSTLVEELPAWIGNKGPEIYFTVKALQKNKATDEKSYKLSWSGTYTPLTLITPPTVVIDYNKYSKPKGFVVNLPVNTKNKWMIKPIDSDEIPDFDITAYEEKREEEFERRKQEAKRRREIAKKQEKYEKEFEERMAALEELEEKQTKIPGYRHMGGTYNY